MGSALGRSVSWLEICAAPTSDCSKSLASWANAMIFPWLGCGLVSPSLVSELGGRVARRTNNGIMAYRWWRRADAVPKTQLHGHHIAGGATQKRVLPPSLTWPFGFRTCCGHNNQTAIVVRGAVRKIAYPDQHLISSGIRCMPEHGPLIVQQRELWRWNIVAFRLSNLTWPP